MTATDEHLTTTDEQAVTGLIQALCRGDRAGFAGRLDAQVRLQALLPRRSVDLTGREAATAEIFGWFEEIPTVVPLKVVVGAVADVWHAEFRFALRGLPVEHVVEEHAYCTVVDGVITAIRLLCSGFRPVAKPPGDEAAHPAAEAARVAVPQAARQLEALGDGCATLTPRIAAALRELAPGQVLAVLSDDASAGEGIAAWSRLTGHQLVASAAEAAGTRYYLRHA